MSGGPVDIASAVVGKAIDAQQQWEFRPATKDGEAVPVELNIDVNFELR